MNPFVFSVMQSRSGSNTIVQQDVTNLLDESFASLPAGWVNNGFTVGSGLSASGTGGMSTRVYYNNYSFLGSQRTRIEVQVNDLASSFAVSKNLAFRGNVAKVDLSDNTLKMGVLVTNGVEPTYDVSTAVTITKTLGATYVLEFTHDRTITYARFYLKSNPTVYNEVKLDYATDSTFQGYGWGSPEAIFFGGNIKITNFKYQALNKPAVKVAIYGDSITEGQALYNDVQDVSGVWSYKLIAANNDNAYLSAQGGITTGQTIDYIDFQLDHLTATYTIILLGANDSNFTTWNNNMNTLISKIEANGSIPVLCTLTPRADRQSFINAANDEIINNKSADYDVIDFGAVVSVGGDRINWKSGWVYPDNTHPTVVANQAMFDEIVNNHSYLV